MAGSRLADSRVVLKKGRFSEVGQLVAETGSQRLTVFYLTSALPCSI